ncbi:DUF1989 domain-containing protein [Paenibacillus beijingensis]|uniref:DUF1989 domain-containing protein n=1 Tax=Paenibacillus beijingensis TaxID=1126833 RepID=A0A0D5NFG5_9BACL|nr:urea carboxylase-associated family protein [Paenibacillus beijingensis]AJY73895.1 hypothetical protein VN24_03805 [Paenibacillus beijingensis]
MTRNVLIPGGEGRSFKVYRDEYIKITDVAGKQVADFVALNMHNTHEFVSASHTRIMLNRVFLQKEDRLYSNYRNALLRLVEDTVGVHDLMYPCCDPMRYLIDYGVADHRNCRNNLFESLKEYEVDYWRVPDPVNLFQNTPLNADGSFAQPQEPKTSAGDYVIFQALADVVVGISACPQDMNPLCGWNVSDIKAEILREI